jgi:hypothetical protein
MKNIQTHQNYYGTASETKPTSKVDAGSTFFETDTLDEFLYTGSTWVIDPENHSFDSLITEGYKANHKAWQKLGFNSNVGASCADIWALGTCYIYPSSGMGMTVSSANVGDTASGAGVRTVQVNYLTSSFDEKSETFTMTGSVTKQSVSTDIYRIENFRVLTAGSTGAAIGNIDISASTGGGVIYSRVPAGWTRARNITWTVPKNKKLIIEEANFSAVHTAANKHTIFTLRANYDSQDMVSTSVFYPDASILLDAGVAIVPFPKGKVYPAGTDVRMTASSNGTAVVSVALRGYTAPA